MWLCGGGTRCGGCCGDVRIHVRCGYVGVVGVT